MRGLLLHAFILLVTLAACGCASAPLSLHVVGEPAATKADAHPLDGARGSLVALVFISHECPIANAMMPEIVAIADEAKARGIAFYAVHPARWPTDDALAAHARDFALEGHIAVLADRSQDLTRRVGATVTPEAALLRLDGRGGFERLYLGRVNDLYAAIGRRRAGATSNDLLDAMRAASEGRAIASPQPKAVGCFIE
jgi:hypothetical protein